MALENPYLLHHLAEILRTDGWSQHNIDLFSLRWSKLRPHQAYPCPTCFAAGEEGKLMPLPEENGVEPVKCQACSTRFDIPMPT
jgi:hypothetical protein